MPHVAANFPIQRLFCESETLAPGWPVFHASTSSRASLHSLSSALGAPSGLNRNEAASSLSNSFWVMISSFPIFLDHRQALYLRSFSFAQIVPMLVLTLYENRGNLKRGTLASFTGKERHQTTILVLSPSGDPLHLGMSRRTGNKKPICTGKYALDLIRHKFSVA
ncbi:hypothetical protein bAD24_p00915 (plasmid) [Burkholderia sp. AD24]|nr:hypothetical protein bAD24_p00915 [Burkholderia sp. AD24]